MAAFHELDWNRFDVWAVVSTEGVAVVEAGHREACHSWLRGHDYVVTSIDFAHGIGPAVVALGERLRWEEQFGYRLGPEGGNLNALRDGFAYGFGPGRRHVLELLNAEVAHLEDPQWFAGLLAIARGHSRDQLALGGRFFAMLVLDRASSLIGVEYERLSVPVAYWTAAECRDPFAIRLASGMVGARKFAYRYLLYCAMMDVRSIGGLGDRLSDPGAGAEAARRIARAGAIANWLHNLAGYSAGDFEGFDEDRFWREYAG